MRIHLHPSFHFQVTFFSEKNILQNHPKSSPSDLRRKTHGSTSGVDLCLAWRYTPVDPRRSIDSGRARVSKKKLRHGVRHFLLPDETWKMKGVWCWKIEHWSVEKVIGFGGGWTLSRFGRQGFWIVFLCRLCHLRIYLLGKLLQFTSLTSRGFHLNTNLLVPVG